MQTEDRRPCPACGAANTTDAANCWQCFARFGATLPPAPGADGGPGQPGDQVQRYRPGFPPPAPIPQAPVTGRTSSLGGSMVLRVLIGLVAASVGFVGVQRLLGSDGVEIPESVAGVERMHDDTAQRFADEMQAEAAKYDLQADAAAFGSGGLPDFLLIVVTGSSWETTDQMFDSLVEGLNQGGMNVDTLRRTGEIDGSAYRCVGAEAAGTGVGVCMWRTDGHVGIVMDLESDTRTAEALTRTVYGEIAG